jgi:hypothetical protein
LQLVHVQYPLDLGKQPVDQAEISGGDADNRLDGFWISIPAQVW